MKKILPVFLFIFLGGLKSIAQNKPACLISNDTKKSIQFYYHDSLGLGHNVLINKEKTYVHINSPVLLFQANEKQTCYYIKPGETINVTTDNAGNAILKIISNSERTNELLFFDALIKNTGIIYHYYTRITGPIIQVGYAEFINCKTIIEKKEKEKLSFLNYYTQKNNCSNNFKSIAINLIKSMAITDRLLLCRDNAIMLKTEGKYILELSKSIQPYYSLGFSPLFFYLRAALMYTSLNFSTFIDFSVTDTEDLKHKLTFINATFKDTLKSFMLARCLHAGITNKFTKEPAVIKVLADCPEKSYKGIILNKLSEQKSTISLKNNTLLSKNGETKQLADLLKSNENSILYIDVWASWCSPCRAEMGYSKTLKNKFSGKKIKFIYISIDEDIENWKRASKEENITENNFLLVNSKNASFTKEFKIETIPRYLIVGKNGIINSNAPRPSDPELIVFLNKASQEK